MKPLAALFVLLGIFALFTWPSSEQREPLSEALALNFALYRNAAFALAVKDKIPTGEVVPAMPAGWQPMRDWRTVVDDGVCYSFGPAAAEEIEAVRELFQGSPAIGRAANGRLTPADVPLPAFIPAENLVSALRTH
jgi:hypothetical protein